MFRGAFTALITPFRDGRVDEDALDRLVDRQLAAGIHGVVPCGTTGEASTLETEEHLRVVARVVERVAGRVPVLAGAGSNNTRAAVALARACEAVGVDGTLQVTPYYNRPSQEGLVAHFTSIADACERPIVLYNVPGRTGCDLLPKTVASLATHPRVVGIKEATGDLGRASELRRRCGPDFTLLSGDDFSLLPFLSAGGHGVISVVSNVLPGLIARICSDPSGALPLHDLQFQLTEALFAAPNPVPTKLALAQLKLCQADVRSPLVELSDEHPLHARMRALLQEIHHDQ